MRRFGILLSLSFLCLLEPVSAAAEQSEGSDDVGEADRESARQHFLRGMTLVQQERWEAALESFEASLALYPTRAADFNRGLCLGLLGRPADAIRALEEHLERYADQLQGERRAEVDRALETNRARVGRLEVIVEGIESAEVLLDGESMGASPLPEPLLINPGRHQVILRAEGISPVSRWVDVGAGDAVSVVMAVERSELTVEPVQPLPPETVSVSGGEGRGLRISGWINVGLAVATLGTALGLLLWNNGRYTDWDLENERLREAYSSTVSTPRDPDELGRLLEDNDSLARSIERLDVITWVLAAVGVAATAAGITLLILESRMRSRRAQLAPSPGGLVLMGQW